MQNTIQKLKIRMDTKTYRECNDSTQTLDLEYADQEAMYSQHLELKRI